MWVQTVGAYRYYSLVLAGFDPIRADAIYDTTADVIALAFVSKMAFESPDKKTTK